MTVGRGSPSLSRQEEKGQRSLMAVTGRFTFWSPPRPPTAALPVPRLPPGGARGPSLVLQRPPSPSPETGPQTTGTPSRQETPSRQGTPGSVGVGAAHAPARGPRRGALPGGCGAPPTPCPGGSRWLAGGDGAAPSAPAAPPAPRPPRPRTSGLGGVAGSPAAGVRLPVLKGIVEGTARGAGPRL